jgi:hypothetical protein
MAALIDGPCWLVPVPASNGSLVANLALARAIADLVSGARVKCAIGRIRPVESSSLRRKRGLFGLTLEEHGIIRTAGPIEPRPAYFVDNIVTTGTTITACRRALGWGIGLAYADASTCPSRRYSAFGPDGSASAGWPNSSALFLGRKGAFLALTAPRYETPGPAHRARNNGSIAESVDENATTTGGMGCLPVAVATPKLHWGGSAAVFRFASWIAEASSAR